MVTLYATMDIAELRPGVAAICYNIYFTMQTLVVWHWEKSFAKPAKLLSKPVDAEE